MPRRNIVNVPFGVGKQLGVPLSRQVADGIEAAIVSGYYKPGQVLPTRKEFAKALGVSERIPREAVALLATKGLVYTRRCLGCVVAEPGERRWLGKVLMVESGYAHYYYHAAVFEAFCRQMATAGYLVTHIVCPEQSNGMVDASLLRETLQQSFDLVVSLQTDRNVVSLLKNSGVKYVLFQRGEIARGYEAGLTISFDKALKDLVTRCQRRGVRSVLQVGMRGMGEFLDLRPYVLYTGIDLFSWNITIGHERIGADNITFGAMQAFRKRLSTDRKWLPDLLFFRDDFLAKGALIALLDAGVRVPEDVRVVTLVNRGDCPIFPKSLARVELDPFRNGLAYAECVLHSIAPCRHKKAAPCSCMYFPGETFP